jgi:RNA ligase (TIGR02306 family)
MKQASIEQITEVKAHPNADRLDLVKVLEYQCVTQKGLYKDGDVICYVQPDSVLPELPWTEGYRQYAPKRVKAVRLRGEWSEGIIIPLGLIENLIPEISPFTAHDHIGEEISEQIGVFHYEPPMPGDLNAKGGLPFSIPKTDEERWENMKSKIPFGELVDVTLKVDGQSWTAYYDYDTKQFGVCGRTMEYKLDSLNNYTRNAQKYFVEQRLRALCEAEQVSLCVRGESYGAGIQGLKLNPHAKLPVNLAIFSVYNIKEKKYENKGDLYYFDSVCNLLDLPTVPFLQRNVELTQKLIDHYSKDIETIYEEYFEGVVIKYSTGSFKIINKFYDANK